jgi:hypothetical protein
MVGLSPVMLGALAAVLGYMHLQHDFFALPAAVHPVPHTSCLTGALEINELLRPEHHFKGQVSSVGTLVGRARQEWCLLVVPDAVLLSGHASCT